MSNGAIITRVVLNGSWPKTAETSAFLNESQRGEDGFALNVSFEFEGDIDLARGTYGTIPFASLPADVLKTPDIKGYLTTFVLTNHFTLEAGSAVRVITLGISYVTEYE